MDLSVDTGRTETLGVDIRGLPGFDGLGVRLIDTGRRGLEVYGQWTKTQERTSGWGPVVRDF